MKKQEGRNLPPQNTIPEYSLDQKRVPIECGHDILGSKGQDEVVVERRRFGHFERVEVFKDHSLELFGPLSFFGSEARRFGELQCAGSGER
jgi:hypothetical protein